MSMRFILVGGFLGAGKTTTIARLAAHYRSQGRTVGVVTNDQAPGLVDTGNLRAQGFAVGEVAGSCFCCNFPALVEAVDGLDPVRPPDVVLAEPVGSCTDLVATVIRPLARRGGDSPPSIAPYGVILKPGQGTHILRRDGRGGFSDNAEYIFRKQLEEADFFLINRIDELDPTEVRDLTALLERDYPGRPVLPISAKTGQGFDRLIELLDASSDAGRRLMDVDYDVYAEGEAEMGWLNASAELSRSTPLVLDDVVLDLVARLKDRLTGPGAEIGHLKCLAHGEAGEGPAVANAIDGVAAPELSVASTAAASRLNLVVNARATLAPEALESAVREEVDALGRVHGAAPRIATLQSFRPGRPVPTYRITTLAETDACR
jgi:Ni2+-binding GTPase involved in maturation of urease and hydrogenase